MLYLIRTFGKGKRTSLKVGYTDKLDERFSVYRAHNPFFEVISTRKGDKLDEEKFHLYLEALGYKDNFMNEWFIDTPEVGLNFHASLEKVEKVIWRNRDRLFSFDDFKSSGNKIRRDVYELLSMKFKSDVVKSKIDSEWLRMKNLELLRKEKTQNKRFKGLY